MPSQPKQLHLFKGKRQRGVKLPPPTEFPIHCMIADSLRRWKLPGWVWLHPPNGGYRNPKEAEKLKRMGTRSGASDFLLFGPPWGTIHAYELKRKGESPTDEQLQFGAEVVSAGGYFAWGDTYDHAIATFQDWGALPRTIHPQ